MSWAWIEAQPTITAVGYNGKRCSENFRFITVFQATAAAG
jgi:hypothetical protein